MVWDPGELDRLDELEPLYYGVPEHLNEELVGWVKRSINIHSQANGAVDVAGVVYNALRIVAPVDLARSGVWARFDHLLDGGEGTLRVIRAMLKHLPHAGLPDVLEIILQRGNSGYAVRPDKRGLEFRVHPAAREQVEQAVAESEPGVGKLLTSAWNAAYGLDPQPEVAYMEAIRTVEAAIRPIVSPDDGSARLGKMIGDLAAGTTKWHLVLVESRPFDKGQPVDGIRVLIGMLELLSYAQKARHPEPTLEGNNVEEARAAVHLAVTVVQWCTQGAFARKD